MLSTFYHDYEYYSGRDVYVAKPKIELSKAEMLYYCYVIEQNKYRYNYGRGANKTFREILVPSYEKLPESVKRQDVFVPFDTQPLTHDKLEFNTTEWQWFRYDDVFQICKGFYNKKPEENLDGEIPFIGATDSNNGITSLHDIETIELTSKTGDGKNAPLKDKIFEPNCITVSNNGSVGYAFYQPRKFTCTHDVNPLYLNKKWNKELNVYISMFLCTIIEMEQFRWAYGRKWRPKRMPDSLIKLPVNKEGNPDWKFMEEYIKGLPYSANI